MRISESVHETLLYQRLQKLVGESATRSQEVDRRKAVALVDEMTREAAALMERAVKMFPEFTLHDERHLIRVIDLMGAIASESESLQNLNYVEILLLILAALLHDVGLVAPDHKISELTKSDDFQLHRATAKSELQGVRDIEKRLGEGIDDPVLEARLRLKCADVESGIVMAYVRRHHGRIGAEFIRDQWGSDPRWIIEGHNIADLVAWISFGHTLQERQLTHDFVREYATERLVGQSTANVLYCTVLLRLADILDFDRERTPNILYENIGLRGEISVVEWNKHRSVNGWKVESSEIAFDCECSHPVYEKAVRSFLDLIDDELQLALRIVGNFPARLGIADKHRLQLPPVVDRSRVRPIGNAYQFLDLSFRLSHDDIMRLLMGRSFWGGTSLCVRELIQNAYDAIRHRAAVERSAGNEWNSGVIRLTQRLTEDNRLELSCSDNGIGMDRHVLEQYFFRVGRSYYKSAEFEQERVSLSAQGADFDPVSQFGLGIVSAFLVGDTIEVETQRFLGPNRGCGEALSVEVEGFTRMAVVRSKTGRASPGTTIRIQGKKYDPLELGDSWSEPLQLAGAVRFYAAALDVPVEVIVEEPFVPRRFTVAPPSRPLRLKTLAERSEHVPPELLVLEKDLSEVRPDSEGMARVVFLRSDRRRITCSGSSYEWREFLEGSTKYYRLVARKDGAVLQSRDDNRAVLAQDGVLVAVDDDRRERLHFFGTRHTAHLLRAPSTCFINLRGRGKLPLKPNRAPYSHSYSPRTSEERQWWEFERQLPLYVSDLLNVILSDPDMTPVPEEFWSVVNMSGLSPLAITAELALEHLPIPVRRHAATCEWTTLANLHREGVLLVWPSQEQFDPPAGWATIDDDALSTTLGGDDVPRNGIAAALRCNSELDIVDGQIAYRILTYGSPFKTLSDTIAAQGMFDWSYFQRYGAGSSDLLTIPTLLYGMNIAHPVSIFLRSGEQDNKSLRYLQWGLKALTNDLMRTPPAALVDPSQWAEESQSALRRMSNHWNKVRWESIPSELQPPYVVQLPTTWERYEITPEMVHELTAELPEVDDSAEAPVDLS